MRDAVRIGNYLVSADRETFRIFPKNRAGQTIPVTRINNFIYLECVKGGGTVIFRRYLHMKQWHWRDSRDVRPCDESDVLRELKRMLGVSEDQARDVALSALMGAAISV